MKLFSTKADLDKAIQVATIGIAGGSDDASLASHYLFRVTDSGVDVLATNGKRALAGATLTNCTIQDGSEGKAFTVAGWRLRQWLQVVPDGALTLDFDSGVVKAAFGKTTTKFASLDPSAFPYWDAVLKDAKVTAKMPYDRLFGALAYVKSFTSDQETRTPHLVATECRDGTLYATDAVSVAVVTVPGLEKAAVRIHGADIPVVLSFLGLSDTNDVEILEHDKCLFFRRDDGALAGVSRWTHEFPKLKIDKDEKDKCSFTVKVDGLRFALKFLSVSAVKDDDTIYFSFPNDTVTVSAASAAGDRESTVIETTTTENLSALSEANHDGFALSRRYVEAILGSFGGETLTFGVNWTPKNGYVRFRQDRGGDDYLAIVVWNRK